MTDNFPLDAVERVRAIRDLAYEETKNMSFEERLVYQRKRYEEAKKMMADIKPDPSRFPFLPQKPKQITT